MALSFILGGASCFKVFLCFLSSCFFIPFSIVIISFGEEAAGLYASRAFVCLFCIVIVCLLFFFLVSGVLATVCDCDTPWTFLLFFFYNHCKK